MSSDRLTDYIARCNNFRVARGEVKLIRCMCRILLDHLEADLEAPLINFDEDQDAEDIEEEVDTFPETFYPSLWYSADKLAAAVFRLREARQDLEASWELLSEDEKSVVKCPIALSREGDL